MAFKALSFFSPGGRDSELSQTFFEEEWRGLKLWSIARGVVLALLGLWILYRVPGDAAAYYWVVIGLFAANGLAHLRALDRKARRVRRGLRALLVFLDLALLTFAIVIPNPMVPADWPMAMQLRLGSFDYFFVFVAFATLTFSPGLALWSGIAAAASWSLGAWWVLSQPASFTRDPRSMVENLDVAALLDVLLDPNYVSSVIWGQEVVLILLVSGVLSLAVWRARRLLLRQVRLAGERANLARYVSPNLVERLASERRGFAEVGRQDASLLFVDIVGFTPLAESLAPEATIALLRDFHAAMAALVFRHGGTLNKYLGDGLMASFGAPAADPAAAAKALACGLAMLERAAAAEFGSGAAARRLEIGVGVHHGPVVIGDLGDSRCLEFAVLGDTVNVAARLESLTRELPSRLATSAATVEAARPAAAAAGLDLGRLTPLGSQALRGRKDEIEVWGLGQYAT